MTNESMSRKQMILFLRDRPTFIDTNAAGRPLAQMPTSELRRLVDAAMSLDNLEQSRAVSHGTVLPVRCEVCDAVMHPDVLLKNPDIPPGDIEWEEWTCLRCCETGDYEWSAEEKAVFRAKLPDLRKQVVRAVKRDA